MIAPRPTRRGSPSVIHGGPRGGDVSPRSALCVPIKKRADRQSGCGTGYGLHASFVEERLHSLPVRRCIHTQNLPQRVGDQIVDGAVLQLEESDWKMPPPIARDLEGYDIER